MVARPARIAIIGAGIGGLTAAALLLQAGYQVTVLEAHRAPGGCAATFRRRGYAFDAGATLVGGFDADGPHSLLARELGLEWPTTKTDPAWTVHLPGKTINQWNDTKRWRQERRLHFPDEKYENFWRRQEELSRMAWQLARRNLPWPPESRREWGRLLTNLRPNMLPLLPRLKQKVIDLCRQPSPEFLNFLDIQLLISAQTGAAECNALYGCAALDLPRRGIRHGVGGTGAIAQTLAAWITERGGQILYGQTVKRIVNRKKRALAISTQAGLQLATDAIIANLTPAALLKLTGNRTPAREKRKVSIQRPFWSAYMIYLGVDSARLPAFKGCHHQVLVDGDRPLGEGNSIFISLSEKDDRQRAPSGRQAVTISTHTDAADWFALSARDPVAFAERRLELREKVLLAAEKALPGFRRAIEFDFDATPLSFFRYTGRERVGGQPQESLFSARGPATWLENLWLVGDSVFPGQSTAAVTLGARRTVRALLDQLEKNG